MHTLLRTGVILGISALLFVALPSRCVAQPANIIAESFDSTPEGSIPSGWTRLDLDSCYSDSSQPFFGGLTVWQAVNRVGWPTHTGGGVCVDAYNANHHPNDDWLILPHIPPLIAPITLSYWMCAQDMLYTESFEVRVSTTTAAPASFTDLIVDTVAVRHWDQHTHDLSAYASQSFYVAIRYTSVDRYALKLDDVVLHGTRPGGVIRGTVRDASNSQPLPGVAISVLESGQSEVTSANGTYLIDLIPSGLHSVRFVKAGFDTVQENSVVVVQGDTVTLNEMLNPSSAVQDLRVLPGEFSFAGNYPNPFNSQTQFLFELTHSGRIVLSLYNTLGQEIAPIVGGNFGPGVHSVSFDARSLTSGIYIARLSVDGFQAQNRKVVLLR